MEKKEKLFDVCPVCGSKERFFKTLVEELKDLGFAREEYVFHFQSLNGVVTDPIKEKNIPLGAEVPGYELFTDICLGCGNIYAVRLVSGPAKKSLPPPKLDIPGMKPPPPFHGDLRRN